MCVRVMCYVICSAVLWSKCGEALYNAEQYGYGYGENAEEMRWEMEVE